MLTFKIYNRYTQVEGATEEQLALIAEWCKKEYHYYGLDWSIRPPRRMRLTSYLNYFTGFQKFPSGWVGIFARRMIQFDHELKVEDLRQIPVKQRAEIVYRGPDLRNYQEEALNTAIRASRGIISHATGAGKTILMAKLLSTLKMPALIMVPDLNLLSQTAKWFGELLGENFVGTIGEGEFNPSFFSVGTVQTIWSRIKHEDGALKKVFNQCEVLILDEAHHINIAGKNKINNTYFTIAQLMDVYYRFGFTATPGEEGDLERELLEATMGKVLHHVSSSYLIKEGYLTVPEIQLYEIIIPQRYREWRTAYTENILRNTMRNAKIAQLAEKFAKEGKSVLITVTRVEEHGVVLNELINDSVLMIGSTNTEERRDILDNFESKRSKILISTVINEGVNIPSIDVIIMAGGGKSNRATVQKVGRALRKFDGKDLARIIDFYDNDGGMLLKHSKARLKTYKAEEAFIIKDIIKVSEEKGSWLPNKN